MENVARIWSVDRSEPQVELIGHTGPNRSASYSDNGRSVVTASADGTARVWAADGSGDPVVLEGHSGSVHAAAFSIDGHWVVTGGEDGTVRVWAADGNVRGAVLKQPHGSKRNGLAHVPSRDAFVRQRTKLRSSSVYNG